MDPTRDPIKRRAFVQGAAIGALAFTVGGVERMLAPSEARAQGVPLKVLNAGEAKSLEAVSEALVPGARQAGVAHFIDQQCSVPPHEALLSARIGNVSPPFANFYRAALTEIDRQCGAKHGKPFAEITAAEQNEFIGQMRQGRHADWKGPPQQRIYAILRDDGVDVVYGTVEGFERLGVPYMPHILPKTRW
jgi:gluconate 2-dehydrogenase subunit 3-like protein